MEGHLSSRSGSLWPQQQRVRITLPRYTPRKSSKLEGLSLTQPCSKHSTTKIALSLSTKRHARCPLFPDTSHRPRSPQMRRRGPFSKLVLTFTRLKGVMPRMPTEWRNLVRLSAHLKSSMKRQKVQGSARSNHHPITRSQTSDLIAFCSCKTRLRTWRQRMHQGTRETASSLLWHLTRQSKTAFSPCNWTRKIITTNEPTLSTSSNGATHEDHSGYPRWRSQLNWPRAKRLNLTSVRL